MSKPGKFTFQLYVAGNAPNSTLAIANLKAFCKANLPGRHQIEVVDVFRHPKRALAEGIFMTPTVVVPTPPPLRRIVGTLSQAQTVLMTLGLEEAAAA